jgi:chemosensory pili system protein ChpA (sensor histidine kinase/response regulator)
MAGEPNQPLRLLPLYLELAQARGIPTARASDLFFPDCRYVRPRANPVSKLAPDELHRLLKNERARYQKGLLFWLTKPAQAETGRQLMLEALTNISRPPRKPRPPVRSGGLRWLSSSP